MQKRYRALLLIVVAALASILILAWGDLPFTGGADATQQNTLPVTTTQEPTTLPPPSVVTFMAVGDNLIHTPIFRQARDRAAGGARYDFAPAYDGARALIGRADLAFINQEVPITDMEPAGWPLFNSPRELGDAVYDMGFRAIQLINNHTIDKGVSGLLYHLEYWESKDGVVAFGAHRDMEQAMQPSLMTVNGIRFVFVGATFSYNGLQLPQGSSWVLPRLEQEELIREMIEAARTVADIVVFTPHWGVEDSTRVVDSQRNLARKVVDWGADIILGTHPHVMQTMEFIDSPRGGQAFIAYSLANFLSGQRVAPNLIGGVLELTITKDNVTGEVEITAPQFFPVLTQYEANFSNIRLIEWPSYTAELARAHGVRSNDSRWNYDWIESFLRENVPEEFLVMEW